MNNPPSFDTMIRAYRLGWGLSRKHGCFIRMSDAKFPNSRVELCPVDGVPKFKTEAKTHRVWWENPAMLDLIPWLKGVTSIKKYVSVLVDNDGEIIRDE